MSFRLLLLTLFAIAAAYLTLVGQIELDPWSAQDTINSRTLPQIYGALLCLAVLGLALGQRDRTGDMSHPSLHKLKPLFWLSALICVFILSLVWLNLRSVACCSARFGQWAKNGCLSLLRCVSPYP